MTLWLAVTKDKYELPLAVADSAAELGAQIGKSRTAIYDAIKYAKKYGKRCSYVRVKIIDTESGNE